MLCGYSLGGRLALRAALRDPGRYRGVVTIGATAGIEEPVARRARAEADERLAAWMETMPIEEIVAVWERQPLFADQSDALVEAQRPGRLSHDPRSLALLLRTRRPGDARARSGTSSSAWSCRCWRWPESATSAYARRRRADGAAGPGGPRRPSWSTPATRPHLQRPEDGGGAGRGRSPAPQLA